ncbi:hypothetical protein [Pseudomonas putida]|uniref:hypothetical protein n=1 Tax=Pseudomonas putida TaxID=303 RepID=UPI002B254275|nr:hypothetical protein [Pseudomonas putida]
MQSADYVPGVSGWKIHDHVRLVLNDGNRRIHAEVKMITTAGPNQTNDEAAQAIRDLIHESKDRCGSRVTACEGKISEAGAPVIAQGSAITSLVAPAKADARAVEALTSRIAGVSNSGASVDQSGYIMGEKPARQAIEEVLSRAQADLALAKRIGSFECCLRDGSVKVTLSTDATSIGDQAAVDVDLGKAIEPLPMGKVTFYGESARAIRDAQEILRSVGLGQLEVVKRANEHGEPFVVIDDQVFVAKAAVESASVGPSPYRVKVSMNNEGRFYVAGVGLDAGTVASELKLGPGLEKDVRRLLREELQPGGILHRH